MLVYFKYRLYELEYNSTNLQNCKNITKIIILIVKLSINILVLIYDIITICIVLYQLYDINN